MLNESIVLRLQWDSFFIDDEEHEHLFGVFVSGQPFRGSERKISTLGTGCCVADKVASESPY